MKIVEKKHKADSEEGFVILEAVVFLVAFVFLTVYVMDTFTAVHTGIVNSIGARTYLFETLQHRSNIQFLRESDYKPESPEEAQSDLHNFSVEHERFHAVNDEDQSDDDYSQIRAAGRRLTQADDPGHQVNDSKLDSGQNETQTIWVKTGYGICVDAACPKDGG